MVPFCSPVSGFRPSAIRLLRSDGSFSTVSEIVLLSCSLVSDTVHEVFGFSRCVTETLPPVMIEL